jgi:hypothetical protein
MGSLATATGAGFPAVAPYDDDEKAHRRAICVVLNNAMQGKLNNTGTFTITANVATTTLTDARIGSNSAVLLMATTANAAGALATTYFSSFANGSCTVNHANNAQVDRTFRYAVVG